MIRCFIIEDEPLAQDILAQYIAGHPRLQLIGSAFDPLAAAGSLAEADLLFLDINLPKVSGLDFYKSLRDKIPVIFTTAYPDYALEGFEVNAIDYLLKPISLPRFLAAIEKVPAKNSDSHLIVKMNKRTFRIACSDILYIESIRDFTKIHTASQTFISADTLRTLEGLLPAGTFARVHKTYIVALPHIEYLEGNQVKIKNQLIPIGNTYREDFFRRFGH